MIFFTSDFSIYLMLNIVTYFKAEIMVFGFIFLMHIQAFDTTDFDLLLLLFEDVCKFHVECARLGDDWIVVPIPVGA